MSEERVNLTVVTERVFRKFLVQESERGTSDYSVETRNGSFNISLFRGRFFGLVGTKIKKNEGFLFY